jgi:hypothetical protein
MTTKQCVIFYNDQIYDQTDGSVNATNVPDGGYVRIKRPQFDSVNWYYCQHGNVRPINLSDVPKTLRMWEVLLT